MRIGVLSDSHDHLTHLGAAVETLLRRGVDAWIHLGDFVAPFTVPPLQRLPRRRALLLGNNDGERLGLAAAFGADIGAGPVVKSLGDRALFLMHEPWALDAAIDSGRYDVVLYGHTHKPDVRRVRRTLVLNPGEVCGWVSGSPTCAVLDTDTLRVELLTVGGETVPLPAEVSA